MKAATTLRWTDRLLTKLGFQEEHGGVDEDGAPGRVEDTSGTCWTSAPPTVSPLPPPAPSDPPPPSGLWMQHCPENSLQIFSTASRTTWSLNCGGGEEERVSRFNLNDEPFNRHRNALWRALRDRHPTPQDLHSVRSLRIKEGEAIQEYLKRAEKVWEENTGTRHDSTQAITTLWRDQCQKGLPEPVQEKLEDVVGLACKTDSEWREHITHWYRRYSHKKDDEKEEVDRLTKALLKQQVAEKNTLKDKAKTKQMVANTPVQNSEDIHTTVTNAIQSAMSSFCQPQNQTLPQNYGSQYQWTPRGRRGSFRGRGQTHTKQLLPGLAAE
ncbi:hypothetical protein INR49_001013 [Caranx melampygus]|nr:hypothetical protein INR49_001013 [Caranx melampygus]